MTSKNYDLEGKTILLTGMAGFIGSNCLVYFVKKYPKSSFLGLDKISYCSDFRNFEEIINNINFKFIKCNLINFNSVKKVFLENKINIVIHLAAYTHVDLSFGNSIKFTKNNVLGTHNLAECARHYGVEKFIHISTDEVYGSKNTISTENSVLDPTNPYSATKAAAENIVRSYYHSFKLPLIITRGNNVYGPKQYPDKIIPLFILNLLKNKKCEIHGTGKQQRSFLHVDDCVRAFETILLKGKVGEIYNIGSEDEFKVIEIAKMLIKKIKPESEFEGWVQFVKDRCFNDQRYRIGISKITLLGWKQEVKFGEGLDKTIKWYTENMKRWK